MADQEQEILVSLQRQYDALHDKLPALLALSSRCSADQKTQFADSVNQALLNLVKAQNDLFGLEEALIQKVNTDVQKAEQEITDSLSSLTNIAQSMDRMTDAVKEVTTTLEVSIPSP